MFMFGWRSGKGAWWWLSGMILISLLCNVFCCVRVRGAGVE